MPSIARLDNEKSKKGKRDTNDFYPTNQNFADAHVDYMIDACQNVNSYRRFVMGSGNLLPYQLKNVLDVGIGDGVYGASLFNKHNRDNLKKKGSSVYSIHGIELRDIPNIFYYDKQYNKTNFLDADFPDIEGGYDLIIGNPPYLNVQDFVDKAIVSLSDTGVLSFLLKASYLETVTRFERFTYHRPYQVLIAARRPIKTHAEIYAVVNFTKSSESYGTKMGWINPLEKTNHLATIDRPKYQVLV